MESDQENMAAPSVTMRILTNTMSAFFGLGAWLATNSIFTQLPLLVQGAPEGWNLPSYLSLIVQIANIGPLVYGIVRRKVNDEIIILGSLVFSTIGCLVLSKFYSSTVILFGQYSSLPLLIIVFFLSLVCCTSSLLFIPFMNHYPPSYLISYMIGEGLSGLVPSLLALFQGIGNNTGCVNVTDASGTTTTVPAPLAPNISPGIFFIIVSTLMALSACAFYVLNGYLNFKSIPIPKNSIGSREKLCESRTAPESVLMSKKRRSCLLLMIALLTSFSNGALPSIQTYSSLPYGISAYHLSVNLANLANPIACFLNHYLTSVTSSLFSCTSLIALLSTGYVIVLSIMSPSPPLRQSNYGIAIVVLAWIFSSGSLSFAKMSIAGMFRREGKSSLFYFGVAMQLGSSVGAIIIFILINFSYLFHAYNPC